MAKAYWKQVASRAFRETCELLRLTSPGSIVMSFLVGLAVIVALTVWGSPDAAHDEWVLRITLALIVAFTFPLIFAFKFFTVPAKMARESDERENKLRIAIETVREPKLHLELLPIWDKTRVYEVWWRVKVSNSGNAPATGVKMKLVGGKSAPKYPMWKNEFPYPVKIVSPAEIKRFECDISPHDEERFDILHAWESSMGEIFTDGLDTKGDRNYIRLEQGEVWELNYVITSDNTEKIEFAISVQQEAKTVKVVLVPQPQSPPSTAT